MCGIVGVHGLDDKDLLAAMMDSVAHRGPDDSGTHTDSGIALGHRRLSIIDLSTGKQPIYNEDGSVVTVYNGEIYNYLKLKKELEGKGHEFRTSTDTEVIVHLYEEEGPGFVKKLRGMFALALWDADKKRLLLARDRIGIKPLYYHEAEDAFLFSSELKSLLEYEALAPRLDERSAHHYLSLQYVPGPMTALEGVRKLMPGQTLIRENGKSTVRNYWELKAKESKKPVDECMKEVDELLTECVKDRLMSDVPLGAYLSGGIDSTVMVEMMSKGATEPVKTFSVGFGYEDVDEVDYARVAAEHYGTDHHEIIVKSQQAIEAIPDIIWHLDEPVGDPAAVPTYFLSKLASEKVKVVLTGEGGDEAFGGYRTYKLLIAGDTIRNMLPSVVKEQIIPSMIKGLPGLTRPKRYLKYVASAEHEKVYMGQGHVLDEEDRQTIYTSRFRAEQGVVDPLDTIRPYFKAKSLPNFLSRLQYVDIKTWMPDDLLMKLDKMTMAHSIEGRVPFLDHKLLEYTMTLKPDLKLNLRGDKIILKKMMAKRLPPEILGRKKQGFRVPMHHWMMKELSDYASEVLSDSSVRRRGLLKPAQVKRLFGRPESLWRGHQIWALMSLELWQRLYIDRQRPSEILQG